MAIENLEPKTRLEYFLNKIAESGSSDDDSDEGDVLVVGVVQTVDGNEVIETLTKTYREIKNAAFAVIVMESDDEYTFRRNIEIVTSLLEEDGAYVVNEIYDTDNVDGYPSNRGNGK